jgi:hypothetical protein
MDSVEEASSYKYDSHASSNIQINGNRGEKAEGTRAMAPSARSKNCTRTYNSPTFFPAILPPLSGITFISPFIRPARY